jgi:mono/diheme cytochrome c family protein
MTASRLIAAVLSLAALLLGGWLAMRQPTAQAVHGPSTWDADDPALGRKAYAMCQGCHGTDGRGVPGYAPALAASRWLTGDPRGAILIALHGFDATSEPGAAYVSSRMLGHGGQLADHEIAAALSWSRTQWGNSAPAISREQVTALRARFASRSSPWSPAELRAILGAP